MKDFRCFDRDPAFVIRSTRPCRNGRRAKSQVGHKQKKEKEKKSNTTSEAIQKNPLQNSISSRTKKNLGKKNSFFFLTLMFSFLEPEAKTLHFFCQRRVIGSLVRQGERVSGIIARIFLRVHFVARPFGPFVSLCFLFSYYFWCNR